MENHGTKTVGQLLRAEREKKGLSRAQVNQTTKISPEVIRALEEDDHSSFASETYLKGFLKNYASFLGLDGPMLWRSMRSNQGEVGGGDETFWEIETTVREERLTSPRVLRRFVLPALILIIIVLTVLLVRQYRTVRQMSHNSTAACVIDKVLADASTV